MAKTQKPSDDEKIVKENIEKRFKNMFTGENEPLSNMSLKEVKALKARVAELETLVAGQQTEAPDSGPTAPVEEPAVPSLHWVPVEKIRAEQRKALAPAALEKFIGSWVTGMSAAVGLASFGVALYFVFGLQKGMMELSDQVLMPFTALIVIANLIGLRLVRHDRTLPGVWISYLINVIVGSVLVVLVIKDLQFLMGGYLVLFSLLFITLVLPKSSRGWASLAAISAALMIAGIEVWNPVFRVSLGNIQNYTAMILGPAVLGFLLLFIIVRQLRYPLSARSLTAVLSFAFLALSAVLLLVSGGVATFTSYINYQENQSAKQLLIAQDAGKSVSNSVQEKFRVLEEAIQFGNPIEHPETKETVLAGVLSLQPALEQVALLDSTGKQLAGISRQSSSLSPQFKSQLVEAVLAQTKAGQKYLSPVYIDDVTSEPQVVIAVPIRSLTGDFEGALAAELNLKFMWDLVSQLKIGKTGYVYVVDYQGNLIASADPTLVLRAQKVNDIHEVKEFLKDPWYQVSDVTPGLDTYKGLLGKNVVGTYAPLVTPVWAVVIEVPTAEAYQPVMRSLLITGLMVLIFGILAGLIGNFLARRLSAPLTELSKVATEISSGNLGLQAKVSGPTEIAQVASTFNAMTHQLHDLIGSLERRVSDRTHDLELAAEVGRTVTEKVTQLSEMLSEAAEMIRARFDLYYTQIYLVDRSGERINLRAGTGNVGKQLLARSYSLPITPGSLNGRSVVEKRTQIVADTRESPTFLPNPLLPNTRSEMSIPLIVGGEVVGVLDMQSEQPGALSESNLPAFEALAGQLAIAIRNTTLFMEAEAAHSEMEAQVKRSTKEGWQEFLNAIQKGHRIGFAFREGEITRLKPEALSVSSNADGPNVPIMMTGTEIGAIHVPADLKANELELVKSISEQLAQHIENLRLLAQAELYREEAEQAVRRLTHEGWDSFLQTHEELRQGYTFDLTEVRPLSEESGTLSEQMAKHAMTIGNEVIGELAADTQDQSDANEVIAAIAEQLSAHIESLRLSELNEKHAQREQTLRQITSALRSSNDPATILRTAVREVGSIMGRRAVVQVISPEQTNQTESVPGNGKKTDLPADRS